MGTSTKPSTRRILGASLVGTAVEFYDFYIYATAASLVFGPLFFPSDNPSAQLLAAYASFAVAFIARPIGALVFGHYGDRIGRKSTLVASLMLMGGSTLAIAFLPTYASVGWVAPVLLCLLRFGQGFGLGGEWGGAALLAVENAPPGWRGALRHVPATGRAGRLHRRQWPVPAARPVAQRCGFPGLGLAAAVPGSARCWSAVGLWVRLKLTETPAFAAHGGARPAAGDARLPNCCATTGARRSAARSGSSPVSRSSISRPPLRWAMARPSSAMPAKPSLACSCVAILFLAAGILLSGWLSDRFDPRRVLIGGCLAAVATGMVLAPMMGSGSLLLVGLFLSLALFVMGFVYGPLGAWLPGLFPARVRYTGASMAFNLGGILGGGLAPIIAQALADRGGLAPVGWYLAAAAGPAWWRWSI